MLDFKVTTTGNANRALRRVSDEIRSRQPALLAESAQLTQSAIRSEVSRFSASGRLERSFVSRPQGENQISVASDEPYAAIQDRGGIVRARLGRSLVVPIGAQGPLSGRLFVAGRTLASLEGRRLVPRYALLDAVRIRPKHYLSKATATATKAVEAETVDQIQEAVDRGTR